MIILEKGNQQLDSAKTIPLINLQYLKPKLNGLKFGAIFLVYSQCMSGNFLSLNRYNEITTKIEEKKN